MGVKFDLGRVQRPGAGAVLHEDDFDSASSWSAERGSARPHEGKLLATGAMLVALKGVRETDAVAAVDIRTDADATLVLRYQDADNYLAAVYSAHDKAIFLRERREGLDGPQLGTTAAAMLGPEARLQAETRAGVAVVALSAGARTVTSPIVDVKSIAAGGVGLLTGEAGVPQAFDHFLFRGSPTVIKDDHLEKKLYDAKGKYRGELKGPGWDVYGEQKNLLLDAYRPEPIPFPQDWVLVLDAG